MAIRNLQQIQLDIKAWLNSRMSGVDTADSTVLSALLLQAVAAVLGNSWTALQTAEIAQGISSPSTTDNGDMDDIAYNLNVLRKNNFAASGFITFRKVSAPSALIQIGNQDGSGGIVVSTPRDVNGSSVQYVTRETVFLTSSTPINPATNFYEVTAPIQAVQSGSVGNQDAGSITSLVTPVAGIDSIINNSEISGGTDQENNSSLAVRMANHVQGLQPGILQGLREVALAQAGVEDASVVGPNDTEFQRSGITGAVDLVVKGQNESVATDQFTFTAPTPYTLQNRPASSISSVIATVGLTQSALTANVQYEFSQDTVSEQQFSINANDHLSWLGSNLPKNNSTVLVSYIYNNLISVIQDEVNLDNNHFPTATVLVKEATAIIIDIGVSITRTGSISSNIMTTNITTAITNYINSLGIGSLISQSNLVTKIKQVAGVKTVNLPFDVLALHGDLGASDIQLNKYQYPSLVLSSVTIKYLN